MITAEEFIRLLAEKNVVSSELIAGLLSRVVQSAKPIPAGPFADRLVERGVISRSLSDSIIEQLRNEIGGTAADDGELRLIDDAPPSSPPAHPSMPQMPSALPPFAQQLPPQPGTPRYQPQYPAATRSPQLPPPPAYPQATPAREIPLAPVPPAPAPPGQPEIVRSLPPAGSSARHSGGETSRARYSQRQIPKNPWDSKLIVFGGGALFLLVFISVVLFFAISRRSAEEVLANAEKAYLEQSYTQAITEYEEFARLFPAHEEVSKARVRISLCRIFQASQGKNPDWANVYNVVKTELDLIAGEDEFRKEAVPELSTILPELARGLVDAANEKSSKQYADMTADTLLLVRRYLPDKDQNSVAIRDVQISLNQCLRNLAADEKLLETKNEIDRILPDSGVSPEKIEEAYAAAAALITEYPDFITHEPYIAIVRSIAEKESKAVGLISEYPVPGGPDVRKLTAEPVAVFTDREFSSQIPGGENEFVFIADPFGAVFALKVSDGTLSWRSKPFPRDRELEFPVIFKLSNGDPLLIDRPNGRFARLDAKTGRCVYRLDIEEPIFFEPPPVGTTRTLSDKICFVSASGRLYEMNAMDGKIEWGIRIPRMSSCAPGVDRKNGDVYQLAEHTTLYRISGGDRKIETVYLGHSKNTVRIPPMPFGEYLLLIEQTSVRDSELKLIRLLVPASGEAGTHSCETVQRIPLEGFLEIPPAIEGNLLFLATDTGQLLHFSLRVDDPAKPLHLIAQGKVRDGDAANENRTIRHLSLFEKGVWIADRTLTRADVQASQSRFLSKSLPDPIGPTLAPLQWAAETVFQVSRERNTQGIIVRAIASGTLELHWETLLADPMTVEPIIAPETGSLEAYTSSGKMYVLKESDLPGSGAESQGSFFGLPAAELVRNIFADPLRAIVPLDRGYKAWIAPPEHWNSFSFRAYRDQREVDDSSLRTIHLFDPDVSNQRRFRSIPLPSPLVAEPIPFAQGVLAPLRNGQIALYNPRNGSPISDPFSTTLTNAANTPWTKPLAIPDDPVSFLVVENPLRAGQNARLFKVELEFEPKPYLSQKASLEFGQAVVRPLLIANDRVFLIDRTNSMYGVSLSDLKEETVTEIPGTCIYGPFGLDSDSFFLANDRSELLVFKTKPGAGDVSETEMKTVPFTYAPIIGKPLIEPDAVIFASNDGTVWKLDRAKMEISGSIKAEVPPSAGVVRYGRRLLYPGRDGVLYEIPEQ